MQEISFRDVFADETAPFAQNKYLLAIYAIEILKLIQPTYVNAASGYMYAITHGELLSEDTTRGWEAYASRKHKDISIETTFESLQMIDRLVQPFVDKTANVYENLYTVGLPCDVARIIQNEDLTDPNVMNPLELSVRNIYFDSVNSYPQSTDSQKNYSTRLAFKEVVRLFQPLLDTCKFRNISETRLLKEFTAFRIHQYGVWLSCLYRLFYPYSDDYWDVFDNSNYNDCIIDRVLGFPAATPETVIGVVNNKQFIQPSITQNRTAYLTLAERYLVLLYRDLSPAK